MRGSISATASIFGVHENFTTRISHFTTRKFDLYRKKAVPGVCWTETGIYPSSTSKIQPPDPPKQTPRPHTLPQPLRALPMTATSHTSMINSADSMCTHRPASHDELLARRHAQRAPRVSSPEAKLTSSFLPADRAPNDPSSDSSSSSPAAPPSASHDEVLARRHAQRAPRVSPIEGKPASSLIDCKRVVHPLNDDTSSESSSAPTSAPSSASPASHDEFLARRHAQRAPRITRQRTSSLLREASWLVRKCHA